MQDLIADVVRERLPAVSIVKLLDGAILFETECSYDRLNLLCFNNIFAVIDILEMSAENVRAGPGSAAPLEHHIRKITAEKKHREPGAALSEGARAVLSENNKKIKTFRLVCSLENKPASINEILKQDIENFIARNSTLKVERSGPDTEFWFLYRREGFSLFMKRLTHSIEKKLRPGELTPQLAWLLCRTGGLKPGETVLDPFCGYGAIAEAALKHFPIKFFYASDVDNRCIKITRSRPGLKSERCGIRTADVFSISEFIPAGGIDAIITDPPWGMYKETQIPLAKFYEETLALFSKLLKDGGRAVILSAAREELEAAAAKIKTLPITQTIPILVSGKKASVFTLKKKTDSTV